MKIRLAIVFILITTTPMAWAQDYYFRTIEPNKDRVNTLITQTVSIDKIVGDTIYAYASYVEFERFKKLGYALDILPYPSINTKNILMATSIEEMTGWDRYPTYEVYREMMKRFEEDYPSLCKLDSIGTSVQGRQLYVVKISDNVLEDEPELEFFYTSTMHGDETTGYILMLRLIDYLLSNYGTIDRVTNLVNNIAIYVNPNANPDGSYYYGNNTVSGSRRYNANNYDLNRNFPDPRLGENPNGPYQPETLAMMDFAEERNFVLSANFHGGIELANFPWDAWKSSTNPHADHNWFKTISRRYADLAQANSPPGYFTGWDNGIAHGGDWYVVSGSRQDYMNYNHHCREITLEISDTKCPPSADLPNYWDYNKEAMLSYIELLFTGIQGVVTNTSNEPLDATITIDGHDKDNSFVTTNQTHGIYFRPIESGTWEVTYQAEGYHEQAHSITLNSIYDITSNDVVLQEKMKYDITFEIKSGDTPVPNATISLNGQTQQTDELGTSTFAEVYEGSYTVGVTHTDYNEYIDEVEVDASKAIQINLTPLGATYKVEPADTKIWPNPFSHSLNIEVSLKQSTALEVSVHNLLGQKVATIASENRIQGQHRLNWTPHTTLPAGLYLLRFTSQGHSYTQKILFAPTLP